MKCNICDEHESKYKYILDDYSTNDICECCGEIVYGKNIFSTQQGRIFQIIALIEYVEAYKRYESQKTLQKLNRAS